VGGAKKRQKTRVVAPEKKGIMTEKKQIWILLMKILGKKKRETKKPNGISIMD